MINSDFCSPTDQHVDFLVLVIDVVVWFAVQSWWTTGEGHADLSTAERAPIGDAEQFTSQGSQGGMSHRCVVDQLGSERMLAGQPI